MGETTGKKETTAYFLDYVNFNSELNKEFLKKRGVKSTYFSELADFKQMASVDKPDVIIYNIELKKDDSKWFYNLKALYPDVPIIVISSAKNISKARSLLDDGGFFTLRTPLNMEELYYIITRAREYSERNGKKDEIIEPEDSHTPLLLEALAENSNRLLDYFASSFPDQITVYNDVLLQKMVEMISDTLDVDIVSLMLIDPISGTLVIAAQKGLPQAALAAPPGKIGDGIAGYVAKIGQPMLVDDIKNFQNLPIAKRNDQYKTGSFISLPLKIGSRAIGVINVNNKRNGKCFTNEDLLVLETLKSQILLFLRNSQLLHDQRNQYQTSQVLNEIDRLIILEDQPEEMLSAVLNKCREALECETLILFLLDKSEEGEILYVRSFLSTRGVIKEPAILDKNEGIEGMVIKVQKPVLISTTSNDNRISDKVRNMVPSPINNIAAYPIIMFNKAAGIIEAINKIGKPKFLKEDLYLMKQFTYKVFLCLMKNNLYNEKAKIESRLAALLNRNNIRRQGGK